MGGWGTTFEGWYPKQKVYGTKQKFFASWHPQKWIEGMKIINDDKEAPIPEGGCLAGVLTNYQYERLEKLEKEQYSTRWKSDVKHDQAVKRLKDFKKEHDVDDVCLEYAESLEGVLTPVEKACSFFVLKDVTRKDPQRPSRSQVKLVARCMFRDIERE